MAFNKHLVMKWEDVENYLTIDELQTLTQFIEEVNKARKLEGKSDNQYLVINQDEPYADKLIKIMKAHGHWG